MAKKNQIRIFENRQVRSLWDDEVEDWYFSIVDVVAVLTEQTDQKKASTYWSVLKGRLRKEGADEPLTKCKKLKMLSADGKNHPTDAATVETLFRIIQSIPSKKAEPFKQWMAQVAAERLNQMQDPELDIDQAIADYHRLGYPEEWITRRIKTIEIRKDLTDEWKRGGVTEKRDFAFLTDLMSKTWSGLTTKEYKELKGLKKQNLRDNMSNMELLLNALAEESASELSKERNPKGMRQTAETAVDGASVAKTARDDFERRLGHSVVTSDRAIDHTEPAEELPFHDKDNPNDEFFQLPGDLEV